jgi:branched-chain amino acid aminotransferase
MEAHLDRLERSARAVSLNLPPQYKQIRDIIKASVLKGGEKDCLIRVTISRGPGGFTTDPFECPASQMYINVVRYLNPPQRVHAEGIPIITSTVPVKKPFFATIKSCNYLPNVLMKMEAINAGCGYSIALDEDGFLAEAPTENISVLSRDGVLKFPGFEKTLAGITAKRNFELADVLVKEKRVTDVRFDRIPAEEAYLASEIMLMGTSINLIPVVSFDGHTIGQGAPGPAYRRLSDLLEKDMTENSELLTDIDWRSADL